MTLTATVTAREKMLKSQILTGHVLEPRILEALLETPRELFVPEGLQGVAYVDEELPLGSDRYLVEPLVFARMLKQAAIQSSETVLDVGGMTGYSAAVLSHLAQKVVMVEENVALATRARTLLARYPNVECTQSPLAAGCSKYAPYDVVFIEGAIEVLPPSLGDQLREGGRLYTMLHDAQAHVSSSGLGKLAEYKKVNGKLYKTIIRDANGALIPQFKKPSAFAF